MRHLRRHPANPERLQNFQQFYLKHQGAEWRNRCPGPTLAIGQFLWDSQFPFGTYRHQSQRFNPAGDHAIYREFSRFAARDGAIKYGAINKLTV